MLLSNVYLFISHHHCIALYAKKSYKRIFLYIFFLRHITVKCRVTTDIYMHFM